MADFYNTYLSLCKAKGKAPITAAVEAGVPKSAVSNWAEKYRKGKPVQPRENNVERLCEYFGVTRSELFGEKEKATGPLPDDLASQRIAFFGEPGQAIDKDELAQLVLLKERMKAIKKIDSILEGLTDEQVIHFAKQLEKLHNQQ